MDARGTEVSQAPRPQAGAPSDPEPAEEAVFVLRYDEEITCLLSEGVIRPGMLPSGFREA